MTSSGRVIATYYFEGGSTIRITIEGTVDTLEAIEMAERLLKIKREEIVNNAPKRCDQHTQTETNKAIGRALEIANK